MLQKKHLCFVVPKGKDSMKIFNRGCFNFRGLKTIVAGIAFLFVTCGKLNNEAVSPGLPPDLTSYDFEQGNLKITGHILDLALEGDGFFILKQGSEFFYYRRPGIFFRDKDGYFVLGFNNIRLQGIPSIDTGNASTPSLTDLADIKIPITLMEKPRATTTIKLAGNLDSGYAGTGESASLDVYDNSGFSYAMTIKFNATLDYAGWDWVITISDRAQILGGNTGFINFGADGTPDTVGYNDGTGSFAFLPTNTTDTIQITLDMGHHGSFSGMTNFVSPTTVIAKEQDGYPEGLLSEIDITETGEIWGVFTSGAVRKLFQIPIARFPCREGLKLYENKYFLKTEYSGVPLITIHGNPATVKAGCIELDP